MDHRRWGAVCAARGGCAYGQFGKLENFCRVRYPGGSSNAAGTSNFRRYLWRELTARCSCVPFHALAGHAPPLLLVEAAPDAELIGVYRVLEARRADWAVGADLPGAGTGVALGREEEGRI